MGKFRVSVHGKNYKIVVVEKVSFFRKSYVWKRAGFYTTRFVIANTANEAIEMVFALLNDELTRDGRTTDGASMELEEIREDDEGFDLYAPGEGYTFYVDDSA